MSPHLGLQRIMVPSAQVSSLTTGSITLPSAKGAFADTSYESIATVILSSGSSSSITFSSIPSTYAHLQLRGISRSTGAASNSVIRFNGDTGNNYVSHWLVGNGSTATSSSSTSRASMYIDIVGANASGDSWSADVIDILDYANTSKNTTIRSLAGQDFNSTGTTWLTSGLWMNTSAVNSITITCDSVNLAQYSQFALYGIKGA
jgi:hypothetical protein